MENSETEFFKIMAEKLQDLGNYLLILFNGPIFVSGLTMTDKAMASVLGLLLAVTLYLSSYWVFPKGERKT
jgi:hypothetical protein